MKMMYMSTAVALSTGQTFALTPQKIHGFDVFTKTIVAEPDDEDGKAFDAAVEAARKEGWQDTPAEAGKAAEDLPGQDTDAPVDDARIAELEATEKRFQALEGVYLEGDDGVSLEDVLKSQDEALNKARGLVKDLEAEISKLKASSAKTEKTKSKSKGSK